MISVSVGGAALAKTTLRDVRDAFKASPKAGRLPEKQRDADATQSTREEGSVHCG